MAVQTGEQATPSGYAAMADRWWCAGAVRAVFVLALGASVACGDADGSAEPGAEDAFRVALLTSGPVTDAGWYAGAYEGLQLIRDSLGAEISHLETRTPAEFDEAFLSYGTDGYDLVFAHGFEYQDAALRAGERYPDMTIVVSGGGRTTDNVIPLIFELEEGSYLAGVVAGAMTVSGTVGMVGGVQIPPVQGTFDAFRAGVLAERGDARVLESFIGNWDDVAAAKEATVAHLRAGADVIIHNTDAAGFGVFQAVREARDAGREVWAFGMNRDQADVAPELILGSAVIHLPEALLHTARRYLADDLSAEPTFTGIATGGIDFVFNPALTQVLPEGLVDRVGMMRGEIMAGDRDVPRVPFVEGEGDADPAPTPAPSP